MGTILGEYRFRQRITDGRTATLWIIAVNVAVFLSLWVAESISHNLTPATYLALPSQWHEAIHRPWTLLTYMVTHQSLLHLLFNMLWLYWFGAMSERTAGPRALVTTYIAGGIIGGLIYMSVASLGILIPAGSQLIGASASVLCVMTATALRSPNLEISLLLAGPIRLKWFALLCILLAFLGFGGGNSGGGVAHLGGVATGAAIAFSHPAALRQFKFKTRLRLNRSKVKKLRATTAVRPQLSELSSEERLNSLLDKIKTSGYASLTQAERAELQNLSRKL